MMLRLFQQQKKQIFIFSNTWQAMKSANNNKIVFLLTNLAFQAIFGQEGVYSMCKAPMAQTFNYDEAYLGILEAISIVGELVGSISILFLPISPVKGFLAFTLFNVLAGFFLFIPRFILNLELRNFVVMLVSFIQPLCLSSLAYIQVIFSQFYDQNSKKCQRGAWLSLTFIGYIMWIFVAQYTLYNLDMKWQLLKLLSALYLLSTGVAMYLYLGDQPEGPTQIQEMLSIENGDEGLEGKNSQQKMSIAQECSLLLGQVCKEVKKPNVLFVAISFGLVDGLFLNQIFWYPYYFIQVDQSAYSMVSILGCCICICVGGVVFQFFFFQILGLEQHRKNITYFFLLLSASTSIWLWVQRNGDPKLQVILIFVSNLLITLPYNRILTLDPVEEVNEEPRRVKTVYLLAHVFRNIFVALCVIIIGFLMKASSVNLWHVIITNVMLLVSVQTIRKMCMNSTYYEIGQRTGQNQ